MSKANIHKQAFSAADKIPLTVTGSFSLALTGQNVIYGLQLSFFMIALTDIHGLSPATAGAMLMLARFFDAANDPVMGYLTDRTRSRWGKYRPWLLLSPVPLFMASVGLFYNPDLGEFGTLVYVSGIYLTWTVLFTMADVPLWSLTSTITRSADERLKLISIARALSMIGVALPTLLVPTLVEALAPGDKASGYFQAAVIMSLIGAPLILLAFFGVKETVAPPVEKYSIPETASLFWANKPLLMLIGHLLLSFLVIGTTAVIPYFSEYLLGDAAKTAELGGLVFLGIVMGIVLTPFIANRVGKKETVIYTALIRAVILLGYYFVGYGDMAVVSAVSFFVGLSTGPVMALIPVMIGDTIDLMEQKTGKRSEGIAFASQTFSYKAITGMTALLLGIVLQVTGYVANEVQTDLAKEGIFWLLSVLPAISSLMSIVPLMKYGIGGKQGSD